MPDINGFRWIFSGESMFGSFDRLLDSDQPIAVIAGLQQVTALNTVWSLAEKGIPVIGVTDQLHSAYAQTRYCRKFYSSNVNGPELVDSLLDLARHFRQKAVLFLTSDPQVMTISEHRDRLTPFYHIALPSHDVVELMLHKTAFSKYADDNGLAIPRTSIVRQDSQLDEVVAATTLPCIVKPFEKAAGWDKLYKLDKVLLIDDKDVLARELGRGLECVDSLVVQQWIPGPETDIYFDLVYFTQDSDPLVVFSGRKIRQWPLMTGSTTSAEPSDVTVQQEVTIRLMKDLKYKGLGSVEYKLDRHDGVFKIMEPTVGRPDLQSYLSVINGVNIPYIAYCDLTGIAPDTAPETQKSKPVKWICDWTELEAARSQVADGRLTWRSWWSSLRGPKRFAIFSRTDPKPFLITLKTLVTAKFTRIFS